MAKKIKVESENESDTESIEEPVKPKKNPPKNPNLAMARQKALEVRLANASKRKEITESKKKLKELEEEELKNNVKTMEKKVKQQTQDLVQEPEQFEEVEPVARSKPIAIPKPKKRPPKIVYQCEESSDEEQKIVIKMKKSKNKKALKEPKETQENEEQYEYLDENQYLENMKQMQAYNNMSNSREQALRYLSGYAC